MNWLVTLFCGIFTVVGLFMVLKGIENIQVAQETNHWHKTAGVIRRSEINESSDSDGSTYKPRIVYTYNVNGVEHEGQTIYIGDGASTSDISYAEQFVSKYPIDRRVSIHYKPTNPGRSVLEAGIRKGTLIQLAFGIGFAFMGIWFYVLVWLFQP